MDIKKIYKGIKSQMLDEHPWAQKAKEDTNSDAWGPTGTQLNELAMATGYGPQVFNEIFSVLYERLDERELKWRKCYKALVVIDFLLLRGDEHCISPIRIGRFAPKLRNLLHFSYLEPTTGRDVGVSIRKKVDAILELVEDEENINQVRKKALSIRNCVGISSEDNVFSNVASKDMATETYTVGRNRSMRDAEPQKGPSHDDWGNNMNASVSNTVEKSFPRSIIDSPEVHKVTINRNSSGKVSSIEGRKVSDQYNRSSATDYYGGFISAAPSGHPSQESPLQKESKPRKVANVQSHRKLTAPPGKDVFVGNAPIDQSPAPAQAGESASDGPQVIPLHDFFSETQPIQVENNLVEEKDEIISNPFCGAIDLQSTPVGANIGDPSAETPQDPLDMLTPNSELYDWTSKVGFDFTQLNLDTSPTSVKPPKTSKGPSMKSMKKSWETFA